MVKIFLLHFFLHEWICRTACSVLYFLLHLKSLRPKVGERPSAADQFSLGMVLLAHVSVIQPVHSELDHFGYV